MTPLQTLIASERARLAASLRVPTTDPQVVRAMASVDAEWSGIEQAIARAAEIIDSEYRNIGVVQAAMDWQAARIAEIEASYGTARRDREQLMEQGQEYRNEIAELERQVVERDKDAHYAAQVASEREASRPTCDRCGMSGGTLLDIDTGSICHPNLADCERAKREAAKPGPRWQHPDKDAIHTGQHGEDEHYEDCDTWLHPATKTVDITCADTDGGECTAWTKISNVREQSGAWASAAANARRCLATGKDAAGNPIPGLAEHGTGGADGGEVKAPAEPPQGDTPPPAVPAACLACHGEHVITPTPKGPP